MTDEDLVAAACMARKALARAKEMKQEHPVDEAIQFTLAKYEKTLAELARR